MSQENVEVVRQVVAEFNETQQLSELVSPEFVWDMSSWSPWSGQSKYQGRVGFDQFFAEWTDAYEDWTQEVEEITDAGETQVVVATCQRGRLRGSDSWVELRAAFLFTIEGGLLVRSDVFGSTEEALQAAALQE